MGYKVWTDVNEPLLGIPPLDRNNKGESIIVMVWMNDDIELAFMDNIFKGTWCTPDRNRITGVTHWMLKPDGPVE